MVIGPASHRLALHGRLPTFTQKLAAIVRERAFSAYSSRLSAPLQHHAVSTVNGEVKEAVAHRWAPTPEVYLPFPAPIGSLHDVDKVRGTLLASSLQAIRERGLFERYMAALPREYHAPILESIAGTWLPLEVAMAHYRAIDTLLIPPNEVFEIGRGVANKVQGSVLATLARMATRSGVTPWLPLSNLHRLWGRLFEGGGVGVYKLGPKEARCDIVKCPLATFAYFRGAFRGLAAAGFELFCNRCYVTEMSRLGDAKTIVFRIAWA
jgi:hypothetical protein